MDTGEFIKNIVSSLPHQPGVYQYFDAEGVNIYVGKAKDLKKRVSSYFNLRSDADRKLQILVSKIRDIKFTVVSTEAEAFFLENTLIKKNQPKYNINLKDDKTYPSICIKNEAFPRVFATRKIIRDGSRYFGPFYSAKTAHMLLSLIKGLYPLRNCNLKLEEPNIRSGKFSVCLQYHIGACLGPCIGAQTKDEYDASINMIVTILRGNLSEVRDALVGEMHAEAARMNFEKAQEYKEKLGLLEGYQEKTVVANSSLASGDVFSILKEGNLAFCNFLRLMQGAVIYSKTIEMSSPLDQSLDELLSFAILDFKESLGNLLSEVIVPFVPNLPLDNVKYFVPQRGDKLKVLQLSEQNCKAYVVQKVSQMSVLDPEQAIEQKLQTIKSDLNLTSLPAHIECFDNSNTQGTNPVAACVVFRNGKPSKKDYRHFNVQSVSSPDDYASMQEIVYRRYRRMLDENQDLPQLIVVDGGKGQLTSAIKSLKELGIYDKVDIIGLAERLEEIFQPGDSTPLYLNKNSYTLKVLMHLRDEAHRFGIGFHRDKRSKAMVKHVLDDVPGLGSVSKDKLLREYGTMAKVRQAGFDKVAALIGIKQARSLMNAGLL